MKQLRYILIVIGVLSVVAVSAATFGTSYTPTHVSYQPMQTQGVHAPAVQMRSTSAMRYSGSTLPMAAATGVSTTYREPAHVSGGPRRAKMDDPDPSNPFINPGTGEPSTIGDVGNPNEPGTPIGDAVLPLALMALAFGAGVAVRNRRKRCLEGV